MTFGDLYESVEVNDIRVVDGEKSYYARVTNKEFDYDAIVGREIERIYVDVAGNLVAELKYKPVLTVKDLLENCVVTDIVIYDINTDEVYFRGCTDNVGEWLKDRKNGNRKVSHYYVDMNKLYIVVE